MSHEPLNPETYQQLSIDEHLYLRELTESDANILDCVIAGNRRIWPSIYHGLIKIR